jgi:hypothetical protein
MVRIKTCRLTRNPQLGDPVAWLNLTLADGRELDDVALRRSPGGRWFFQGWGWLSGRPSTHSRHSALSAGTALHAPKETLPARFGNGSVGGSI